jgi:hypothetical protein
MQHEALHDTTDLAMNNGRHHGDAHLLVKFFMHPRLNQLKTKEMSRPIYEEQAYIQIMQPGNKDAIIIRPAMEMDKARFAEHYRKFEARESQDHFEGTLLDEWPGITRSQCEELKFLNIRTVEQLANLTDSNAQNVMGLNMLKQKANEFIEASEKNATTEKFAELEAKYDALMAQIGKPAEEATAKPKRTRRSRAEMEAVRADKAIADAEKAAQE